MKKNYIILLLILMTIGYIWIKEMQPKNTDYRPEYCKDNECVPKEVFANLPEYPKDFQEKWILVYFNRISDLNIISEEYWKQPEFYANSWTEQCAQYYYGLKEKETVAYFSAGSGPYPGDVGIENVSRGETLEAITFWHTSCAVTRHQLFSLEPLFPDEMQIRMTKIKINQNPEIAKRCFEINIEPSWIHLNPNYPQFGYNWTQKVKATIKVKEDCPIGEYGIHFIPTDPPKDVLEQMEFKYGFALSSMRVGGAWQIYIKVEH